MCLLLTDADVKSVLTMETCIKALESTYQDMGRGHVVNTVRLHEFVPEPDSKPRTESFIG